MYIVTAINIYDNDDEGLGQLNVLTCRETKLGLPGSESSPLVTPNKPRLLIFVKLQPPNMYNLLKFSFYNFSIYKYRQTICISFIIPPYTSMLSLRSLQKIYLQLK